MVITAFCAPSPNTESGHSHDFGPGESCTGSLIESQLLVLGSPLKPMRWGNRATGEGQESLEDRGFLTPPFASPDTILGKLVQRKPSVSYVWEAGVSRKMVRILTRHFGGLTFTYQVEELSAHSGLGSSPDNFRQTDQEPTEAILERTFPTPPRDCDSHSEAKVQCCVPGTP